MIVGSGEVATITKAVAFPATAGYTTDISGEKQHVVAGNIGHTIR